MAQTSVTHADENGIIQVSWPSDPVQQAQAPAGRAEAAHLHVAVGKVHVAARLQPNVAQGTGNGDLLQRLPHRIADKLHQERPAANSRHVRVCSVQAHKIVFQVN